MKTSVVLAAIVAAACSPRVDGADQREGTNATDDAGGPAVAVEYAHGLSATIHRPTDPEPDSPVVVMVPGGGWASADPAGFAGLAGYLAGAGIMAVPIEIRAAEDGVLYPVPVDDILCALGYAGNVAREDGIENPALIVLGHSSGAHLAALAASTNEPPSSGCPHEPIVPEALVGLAGPYDVSLASDAAQPLFGAAIDEDPLRWAEGNPLNRADERPDVDVLLIHGDSDDLVPVSFTRRFADALETGGHDVRVEIVEGAGHHDVYAEDVVGSIVVDWIEETLPAW